MEIMNTDPRTNEKNKEYELHTEDEVLNILDKAHKGLPIWKEISLSERLLLMKNFSNILRKNKMSYAEVISSEMGKLKSEAIAEIEKCAWLVDVYIENAAKWLEVENIVADGISHKVALEPLGVILSIMPWNFPFWQAIRFAVPTVISGNVSILKHSNQVPGCALLIAGAFIEAGFPGYVFQTILTNHKVVTKLIESPKISGLSFTGSTEAGSEVAELCGKNLKKVVLELGGSDPFIVLADADIDLAAKNATHGRLLNAGQSCIAAKRFIVLDSIYDQFVKKFAEEMEKTEIAPLINKNAISEMESYVGDALKKGATLVTGGKKVKADGFYFQPTVLSDVTSKMRVFSEEVFGPIAPVMKVASVDEAIKVANETSFGLGASIWGTDREKAKLVAGKMECGSVFINSIVKSDPRLPFGGVKMSGIGRELSKYGIREFVNVKAYNIY